MNIHIKGRLVGNSCLWIFTRVDGVSGDIPPLRPICMIRKMVDTQRVFCVFGHKSPTHNTNQAHIPDFFNGKKNPNQSKRRVSRNSEHDI